MLFRVHAETIDNERVQKDAQAGSPQEAAAICRKIWEAAGVKVTKVLKTKVVKST